MSSKLDYLKTVGRKVPFYKIRSYGIMVELNPIQTFFILNLNFILLHERSVNSENGIKESML